jgi:hypothetical protein
MLPDNFKLCGKLSDMFCRNNGMIAPHWETYIYTVAESSEKSS